MTVLIAELLSETQGSPSLPRCAQHLQFLHLTLAQLGLLELELKMGIAGKKRLVLLRMGNGHQLRMRLALLKMGNLQLSCPC